MPEPVSPEAIAAVRRFSRFYTRRLGVLHEGLLGSPFSLTEARVLYELTQTPAVTAKDLAAQLALDPGYLSRILKRFGDRGLIARRAAAEDGRRQELSLTEAGRAAFAQMDSQSQREVADLLAPLPAPERTQLVAALDRVERLLAEAPGGAAPAAAPVVLRGHRPGDIGWVVSQHGRLYSELYGWDGTFEAFVAEIAAKFVLEFDPRWERCWIAERAGETLGSVFLVRQSDTVAKLRMLIVDPKAQGLGIGRRLVEACIAFARANGYRRITLWTNDVLTAARAIYEKTGFRLVASEKHHSFGQDLVGETWELEL